MKAALKITDVPTDDESLTELKGVAYMQRVANDAGALANTLLAITKDALKDATQSSAAGPARHGRRGRRQPARCLASTGRRRSFSPCRTSSKLSSPASARQDMGGMR